MRWSVEVQIHSTYTTSRYFETRMATFCSDIEEPLKLFEVKDKGGKGGKGGGGGDEKPPKADKGDKAEKGEKGEKGDYKEKKEKKDKDKKENASENGTLTDPSLYSDAEYQEFLEFKKFKERLRRQSLNGSIDSNDDSVEHHAEKTEK